MREQKYLKKDHDEERLLLKSRYGTQKKRSAAKSLGRKKKDGKNAPTLQPKTGSANLAAGVVIMAAETY